MGLIWNISILGTVDVHLRVIDCIVKIGVKVAHLLSLVHLSRLEDGVEAAPEQEQLGVFER